MGRRHVDPKTRRKVSYYGIWGRIAVNAFDSHSQSAQADFVFLPARGFNRQGNGGFGARFNRQGNAGGTACINTIPVPPGWGIGAEGRQK